MTFEELRIKLLVECWQEYFGGNMKTSKRKNKIQQAAATARRAKVRIAKIAALDKSTVIELHVEDAPLPPEPFIAEVPVLPEELPAEHKSWWDKLWD
jgi:hypothetical protein